MEKGDVFFRLVEDFLLGLFHLTRFLTYVLPAKTMYSIFDAIGAALYYARPRVRRDLVRKISDAMPEISDPRELERIARKAYSGMFVPMLDMLLFYRFGERFMREMIVEGMDNWERGDAEGNGLIILATHMGVVFQIPAIMARKGREYSWIVLHPDTSPVPRYMQKMADLGESLGCDPERPMFWAGPGIDVITQVREHLAKGKRVGVGADVIGKHPVMFFGRPAALADGLAHFAIDSGAPIVPVMLTRTDCTYMLRLTIDEPVSYDLTGDRKKDVATIMDEVAKAAERQIRRAPEQWMSWFGLWRWWDKARELEGK